MLQIIYILVCALLQIKEPKLHHGTYICKLCVQYAICTVCYSTQDCGK